MYEELFVKPVYLDQAKVWPPAGLPEA